MEPVGIVVPDRETSPLPGTRAFVVSGNDGSVRNVLTTNILDILTDGPRSAEAMPRCRHASRHLRRSKLFWPRGLGHFVGRAGGGETRQREPPEGTVRARTIGPPTFLIF